MGKNVFRLCKVMPKFYRMLKRRKNVCGVLYVVIRLSQKRLIQYEGNECMKICPYCNCEMQEGYLPGESAPVYWLPKETGDTVFRFHVPDAGIELEKVQTGKFLNIRYKASAYYCKKCRIVIAKASC